MLDYEVVSAFAEKRLIYESLESSKDGGRQYHNAIFVGYDPEGKETCSGTMRGSQKNTMAIKYLSWILGTLHAPMGTISWGW